MRPPLRPPVLAAVGATAAVLVVIGAATIGPWSLEPRHYGSLRFDLGNDKPLPPLPTVHGVMNIDGTPIVMMSDKAGARQRGIHPGDKIGEFKLVSVNNDELVLSWEDRTVSKKLEELIDRGGGGLVHLNFDRGTTKRGRVAVFLGRHRPTLGSRWIVHVD